MSGLKDLIGRRFRFERSGEGKLEPVEELPSATWIHPDGTIQPVDLPKDTPVLYSKLDSILRNKED